MGDPDQGERREGRLICHPCESGDPTRRSKPLQKLSELIRGNDLIVAPERRTPEYLQKFVVGEIAKWAVPIKASGVVED